jgi:hypothetical protein
METEPRWHLAQVNVARMLEPLDSPLLADFVAALDPVNDLADKSDGFVWRLQDEAGDATSVPVFGDPSLIVNLSVWRDHAALRAFVYDEQHRAVLRRRREWFARPTAADTALWWVPAGTLPTVADAEERLTALREHGPGPFAFTLAEPLPAPTGPAE